MAALPSPDELRESPERAALALLDAALAVALSRFSAPGLSGSSATGASGFPAVGRPRASHDVVA
jgi:hypothetical protein